MRLYNVGFFVILLFMFSCAGGVGNTKTTQPQQSINIEIKENKQVSVKLTWITNPWEALDKSMKENKFLFVFFHAPWCEYCVKFNEVLEDENVKNVLSKYVLIKIDIDENKDFVRNMNVSMIPTCFLLDMKNEKDLVKTEGYMSAEDFVNVLVTSEKSYRNSSLEKYVPKDSISM